MLVEQTRNSKRKKHVLFQSEHGATITYVHIQDTKRDIRCDICRLNRTSLLTNGSVNLFYIQRRRRGTKFQCCDQCLDRIQNTINEIF